MSLILPRAFWPLTITAGQNDAIDVVDSGDPGSTWTAIIAPGIYYSPTELAVAVEAALTVVGLFDPPGGMAFTCTVNATGRVVLSAARAFSLKFSTGPNAATSARDVLGFAHTDTASATPQTSPYQHQNGWYGEDPVVDDTGWLPQYERAQALPLNGPAWCGNYGTRSQRVISLAFVRGYKTWVVDESSHLNESLERLWTDGWMRVRWWADALVDGTYVDMVMDLETAKKMPRRRLSPGNPMYAFDLTFWRYLGADGAGVAGDAALDGGMGLY
jgi:hypothetical protein